MSTPSRPRLSGAALAALVLGLASPLLSVLAGVPAMLVGLRGLRAINAADGRLRGRGLAMAGMALGALTTALTAVGVVAWVLLWTQARAARAVCANNLRTIGFAVNAYADSQPPATAGQFPRAAVPDPGLPPDRRASWYVAILPYLGEEPGTPATSGPQGLRKKEGERLQREGNPRETRVKLLLCPALPHDQAHAEGGWATTYPGLAGIDPDAAELPRDSPRAGVFGYDRVVTRQDVTAGISYTMLAVETTARLGPWAAAGPPTVRGLAPTESHYLGLGRPFGGLHAGGANVLLVDSSVRFVPDNVSPDVFRSQATLAGKPGE